MRSNAPTGKRSREPAHGRSAQDAAQDHEARRGSHERRKASELLQWPGPQMNIFTAEKLREILGRVIRQGSTKLPTREALEELTYHLNGMCGLYSLCVEVSRAKLLTSKIEPALAALTEFFEERKKACMKPSGPPPNAAYIKNEQLLYGKFYEFLEALRQHTFALNMDQDGWGRCDKWENIAMFVRVFFTDVMVRNNPRLHLGLSNDGPVPRFVTEVIPMITGDRPTLAAVAQSLKRNGRMGRTITDSIRPHVEAIMSRNANSIAQKQGQNSR